MISCTFTTWKKMVTEAVMLNVLYNIFFVTWKVLVENTKVNK